MRLLFSLILVLLAPAALAEVPPLKPLTITDLKFEGNGCPAGSVNLENSWHEPSVLDDPIAYFDFEFSQFGYIPRYLGGKALREANCYITMIVEYKPGYKIYIDKIWRDDYMWFELPKDVQIKSVYYIDYGAGLVGRAHYNGMGRDINSSIRDPSIDVVRIESGCSGRAEIRIETTIKVNSDAKTKRDDDEIDDISMALVDREILEVPVEKCKEDPHNQPRG